MCVLLIYFNIFCLGAMLATKQDNSPWIHNAQLKIKNVISVTGKVTSVFVVRNRGKVEQKGQLQTHGKVNHLTSEYVQFTFKKMTILYSC